MEKRRTQFSISAEEELDLKHQGSLGGDHLRGRYGRVANEGNISNFGQPGKVVVTPGREPAEGPDVAMTSPSHERWEQQSAEREPTEGPEQERGQQKSTQKHHYK